MYYANLAEAFQIPEAHQNEEVVALIEEKEDTVSIGSTAEEEQNITSSFPCKCRSNFDMNHFIIILLLIIIFFKK